MVLNVCRLNRKQVFESQSVNYMPSFFDLKVEVDIMMTRVHTRGTDARKIESAKRPPPTFRRRSELRPWESSAVASVGRLCNVPTITSAGRSGESPGQRRRLHLALHTHSFFGVSYQTVHHAVRLPSPAFRCTRAIRQADAREHQWRQDVQAYSPRPLSCGIHVQHRWARGILQSSGGSTGEFSSSAGRFTDTC